LSIHQHATIEDTVYFWFGANDTGGSGADGATPVYDVRLAGAAAGAIPTLSGTGTLLTHANYPAGAHEIAVAATAANGFSANATYAVFCTLLVDAENPTGFAGSFTLTPLAKAATALSSAVWTAAKAAFVDASIAAIPTTAMRGTDGANTTVPDAAGTAAGLHGTTDAAIAALNNLTAAQVWELAGKIDGATPQEALQIIAAAVAGILSGAGSGTEVFLGLDGLTTRITATIDGTFNRTAVVTVPP